MNLLEKLAMNNPIRFYIQRHFEAPLLEKLGAKIENLDVLEVGCAHGVGTEILLDCWKAKKVDAIDLDPKMIQKAKKRLSRYPIERLKIAVGDVTQIEAKNQSYDAVINFAAIHHVGDWKKALKEIDRVLKPGGLFIFQEVTSQWIRRGPYCYLFKHPSENRFNAQEFKDEIESLGFDFFDNWTERARGDFIFAVAKKRSHKDHPL